MIVTDKGFSKKRFATDKENSIRGTESLNRAGGFDMDHDGIDYLFGMESFEMQEENKGLRNNNHSKRRRDHESRQNVTHFYPAGKCATRNERGGVR